MLAAFGVTGAVSALPGGQGSSFAGDGVVLKPAGDDEVATWLASVLDALPHGERVRIIRPVRAGDGRWVVDGWCAWHWLDGVVGHDWRGALAVSAPLHDVLAAVPWAPAITERPTHPWATGHRAARVDELGLPSQLVHADLGHNILWHASLPPAVIDVSPWWAPVRYADAIIAVDAVAWWDTGEDAVATFLADDEGRELLARAMVFRIVSGDALFGRDTARGVHERRKLLDPPPLAPVAARARALIDAA